MIHQDDQLPHDGGECDLRGFAGRDQPVVKRLEQVIAPAVCLLFLVLRRMTGQIWFATVTTLLFAVHPLRVESVAWVSERKDVLSGFFFLLTLWAWVKHTQSTATHGARPAGEDFWRSVFYWLALAAFACGLMSKPMLVSVPVVLLLLDFWPLGRFSGPSARGRFGRLLVEKLPFVALALASCLVTLWAQGRGEAIIAMDRLPVGWRLLQLPLSYAVYLKSIFWPQHLAIFYPYSHTQNSWVWFVATALPLGGFTWYCVRERQRRPWLLVGWSWFGVMLLPVIGLVQVGIQSTADRYTYLPSIGIAIIVAWLLEQFASRSRPARILTVVGMAAATVVLGVGVRHQLVYGKDSVTLFGRALAVNGENQMIRYYLANACWTAGDLEATAVHYRAILAVKPQSEEVQYRLGYVLMQQQKPDAARARFGEVLSLNPKNINAHLCQAFLSVSQQKFSDAAEHFMGALLLRPGDNFITTNLMATLRQADAEEGFTQRMQQLATTSTSHAHAHAAMIWLSRNEFGEAKSELENALALKPNDPELLNHLAWLLATSPVPSLREGGRATESAQRACERTQNHQARTIITLSAALARAGRFEAASVHAQRAIALASAAKENDLVSRGQILLELFH